MDQMFGITEIISHKHKNRKPAFQVRLAWRGGMPLVDCEFQLEDYSSKEKGTFLGYYYWKASWIDEKTGKSVSKGFSEKIYGEQEAFEMACACRKAKRNIYDDFSE